MKRTQTSQKRTKFLFILIVLTAILSITATYAWFSTQRTVEIVGMRLNVEVAESMQISLDGEKWAQSISIADMRQFYGTYTATGSEGFAVFQAKKAGEEGNGNTNYVPTELLPVSSAGTVSGGKLQFVQGTLTTAATGTMQLGSITKCSEADLLETNDVGKREKDTTGGTGNANHPYLVFDMYLRNISARNDGTDDPLILNTGSRVWIDTTSQEEGVGVEGTGLEYSSRVGFVIYDNTVDINVADTGTQTVGQQIRGITASESNDVAVIWEPNHLNHTNYVVTNNKRISSISEEVTTYAVKFDTTSVDDIDSTTDSGLTAPQTMKPAYSLSTGTTDVASMTDVNGVSAGIAPNKISRVRVYVWLEGQDPDCIDMASTGDKLNVTIKLDRNPNTNSDGNSYKDPYNPGT